MNGHGATTDYTLDAAGNITRELVTGDGARDVTYAYAGNQLTSFTYAYDLHGSVSLLLADSGTATASYGYRPYGAADPELTRGDANPDDALNP